MDIETLETLWIAITQIEAQNSLSQININSFPRMKKKARQKMLRDLKKLAYPSDGSNAIDARHLKTILKNRG